MGDGFHDGPHAAVNVVRVGAALLDPGDGVLDLPVLVFSFLPELASVGSVR
jgi:hypothetical protein